MDRYFKGYEKDNPSRKVIFVMFDEEKTSLFGKRDSYMIEARYLDSTAITRFTNVPECEERFIILREIQKEEYDVYISMLRIIEELFLNQFNGGFPSFKNVENISRTLHKKIEKALESM